jgi:hypothetical protein
MNLAARIDISTLIVSLNSNCPATVNNVREALAVFLAEMIKVAQKLSPLGEDFYCAPASKLVAADLIPELRDCHRLEAFRNEIPGRKKLNLLRRKGRKTWPE